MIKNMPHKVLLYVLAGILTIYTLAGFFLAPWAAKKVLVSQLTTTLNRQVAVDKIYVNPYSLVVEVSGFSIKNKDGSEFISTQSLFMNCSIISLFKLAPVVTRVKMDSPVVNLVLNQDNTFNFSDLLKLFNNETTEDLKNEDDFFEFRISRSEIVNGNFHFSDKIRKTDHSLEKFNLNLAVLTSLKGERQTKTNADIDFVLNQSTIKIEVDSLPFSSDQQTRITLKTDPIDLMHYKPYLSLPQHIKLNSSKAGLDIDLAYSKTKTNGTLVLNGGAVFSEIKIQTSNPASGPVSDLAPLLSIPQIDVTFAPSDLLANKLGLALLKVSSPDLHLNRNPKGIVNILPDSVINHLSTKEQTDDETLKPGAVSEENSKIDFTFWLDKGEIQNASLTWIDQVNPLAFKTKLSPISIQINKLAASPQEIQGDYEIAFKTEGNETLNSNGHFSTASLSVDGNLSFDKINIAKYAPYYSNFIGFDIPKGEIQGDLDFSLFIKEDHPFAVITTRNVNMNGFEIWDRTKKKMVVSIPELSTKASSIDMEKQRFDLGQVLVKLGKINIKRESDNSINLINMVLPSKQASPKSSTPVASNPKTKVAPWELGLKSLVLNQFGVSFTDASTRDPVSLELSKINVNAKNFQTWGKEKTELNASMAWNKEGSIQIKGQLTPSLKTAGLYIDVQKIDIKSLQPYFSDLIKLTIANGDLFTKGHIDLSIDKKNEPSVSFTGETGLTNFRSQYKDSGQEFLSFNSFYSKGTTVSLFPVKIDIKEISLSDFNYLMTLTDKGFNTLLTVLETDAAAEPETAAPLKPIASGTKESGEQSGEQSGEHNFPDIQIEKVTFQGGNINLTDQVSKPNFTAEMKEINGSATNISSTSEDPAEFYLQGLHGDSSPLVIQGQSKAFDREPFFHMDISFKNIELVKFSPYASQYLGHRIESGKLILDLNYEILGNNLESNNRLFFDQLTLGDKVKSDTATSLPIGLAISLLQNSEGEIDLNIPMSGNLEDPKFSFSSEIFKVFGNVIAKIVSAPFKFLGSLFDGGEDLGYVNFKHGSDIIPTGELSKIDKLADILSDKEKIKLEIEGNYDRVRDGDVLRANQYENLLESFKVKELEKKKKTPPPIAEIILLPKEKEAFILKAYKTADFPKPLDENGKEKKLTLEEKQSLLISNINISEFDLEKLAMNRAENIRSYLLSTEKISPERIFLHDPNPEEIELQTEAEENRYSKALFLLR